MLAPRETPDFYFQDDSDQVELHVELDVGLVIELVASNGEELGPCQLLLNTKHDMSLSVKYPELVVDERSGQLSWLFVEFARDPAEMPRGNNQAGRRNGHSMAPRARNNHGNLSRHQRGRGLPSISCAEVRRGGRV